MTRSALFLSLLSLTAMACGGGGGERTAHAVNAATGTTGTTVTATAVDPCALVSSRDMAVMFGELKDGPLTSSGLRGERQCNFTNMAGSWIKLSLASGRDRWESDQTMANAQSPRSVGGLGDEAFAIRRGTDSVVFVRKGDSILELSCSCPADTAEAIARVATTKL